MVVISGQPGMVVISGQPGMVVLLDFRIFADFREIRMESIPFVAA
jgi:hypothetical protein